MLQITIHITILLQALHENHFTVADRERPLEGRVGIFIKVTIKVVYNNRSAQRTFAAMILLYATLVTII